MRTLFCSLLLLLLLPLATRAQTFNDCPTGCQPQLSCTRCDDRHKFEGRETCFDCTTGIPVTGAVLACTACRFNLHAARWMLGDCSPCSLIQIQETP